MDQISDMNNMIASASEEQTAVTSGVSDSMRHMHSGAQGLVNEAEQLEQAIVKLSDLQHNLIDKIQQFKY
jgi:methyl-accepting chemotaxis protein